MAVYEIIILKVLESAIGGDIRASKLLFSIIKQNERSAKVPLSIKKMSDSELILLKHRILAEQRKTG